MVLLSVVLISISIFEIIDMKKNNYKKEIYVFLALVVIAFAIGSVYSLKLYKEGFVSVVFKLLRLKK